MKGALRQRRRGKRRKHSSLKVCRSSASRRRKSRAISFAGGLPAPELFPVREIIEASRLVLENDGARALQYTTTEGFAPLRARVASRMNARLGTDLAADQVLITHGSQQALDLAGKVFLDEGDVVLCESPTYLAAISAFRAYGCDFLEVPTDDEGMIIDKLDALLASCPRARLIYVIPDFQNPTGRTWSLERRQALAEVSARHGVAVIEDNPYGELRFEGDFLPSVKHFDKDGNVLITGTFSKIFCPGYRIGWVAGDAALIRKFVLVKQGTDLQCNTLAQMEIEKYMELNDIDAHIRIIRATYKRRRDIALETMDALFPKCVTYTRPGGGLFMWVTLPEHLSARDLLVKCLEKNVAFVPGGSFFPAGGHENTFRLNFSNTSEERLREGMERLAEALREAVG